MGKKVIFIFAMILWALNVHSENREIPFTLEDRDRIIKLQAEVASLRNEMTSNDASLRNEIISLRNEMITLFESQQRQIDDLKAMFFWGFGILITLSLFMLGYIIWDRRTVLHPVQKKIEDVREKYQTLLNALRELAKEQPRLSDVLHSHGLL